MAGANGRISGFISRRGEAHWKKGESKAKGDCINIKQGGPMHGKWFVILGSLNLFVGVALGAFGAHGLRSRVSVEMLEVWHTAVEYQLVHALGLLVVGLVIPQLAGAIAAAAGAGWLMLVGIVIFSGSLYGLVLTGMRWLGAVTPFGGALFLLAWLLLVWGVWRGWR